MESTPRTDAFAALAHPGRLAVFRLLARRAPGGVRPGEIAAALGMKANTASVHLGTLADAGLIRHGRDPEDGRIVSYRLDIGRTRDLIGYLVNDCCRGRPDLCVPPALDPVPPLRPGDLPEMDPRPFNVLFICTANSARSIFAEAILAREGGGKFRAFSAGTRPNSTLNPDAVALLQKLGHDTAGLRSKTVAEFQRPDAPTMDFVFTVCDLAANEECPPWPGQPISAHWGMPDPVKVTGNAAERALAMATAYRTMRHRLQGFLQLPVVALDRISLQKRLDALGMETPVPDAARP